jgi:hypothetical protein
MLRPLQGKYHAPAVNQRDSKKPQGSYITSNKRAEMLGLFGLRRSGGSGAGYQAGKSSCILDRDVRKDFAI